MKTLEIPPPGPHSVIEPGISVLNSSAKAPPMEYQAPPEAAETMLILAFSRLGWTVCSLPLEAGGWVSGGLVASDVPPQPNRLRARMAARARALTGLRFI